MFPLVEKFMIYISAALAQMSQSADIVFAGDAMQHAAQIEAAQRAGNGSHDYSDCFDRVTPYVSGADYAVVNLEAPLGGKPYSGYPCFSAPDEYAEALRDAGFDLFLTANNHTLDRRDRGLARTIESLDRIGVDHIGTYLNDSCRNATIPFIKDVKGYRVGFLNYTYGTNGIKAIGKVVVDYIDTLSISRDIEATRIAGAEILVVAIHWGDEYKLLPNATQRKLGQFLLDKGVDIVMGGHPHVIQPMELRVDSTDRHRRQLLVYSLGNFISNMKTRDTRGGVMARVVLKRTPQGRAYVDSATYVPVFTVAPENGRNYRLVYPQDSISPLMNSRREQFLHSARSIFEKHNVLVDEEIME
ncbi:MAG: CapA family protein [Clostridiales bacterium]|nr:CapA family protein [Clostridiales bacterium]